MNRPTPPDSDGNASLSAVTEDALLRALEATPDIPVPHDFAQRVLRQLPKRQRRSLRGARALAPRYGSTVGLGAAVVALLLLTALPAPTPGNAVLHTGTELLLSLELLCGALWCGVLRWRAH